MPNQTVQLSYVEGVTTFGMNYQIYSLKTEDAEFEKNWHDLLNGGHAEDNIGYRNRTSVDFLPLGNDKSLLYFLLKWAFASYKLISWNGSTRVVALVQDSVPFNFLSGTFFANAFTLEMVDKALTRITDTGSTRIIRPSYLPGVAQITGDTLDVSADLEDDSSADIEKKTNLEFAGGNRDETSIGYTHRLNIQISPLADVTIRNWIRDFCLWGKKQIDTRLADPIEGKVYDVVCMDKDIRWAFAPTMDALSTALTFIESTARTVQEVPSTRTFIWDESPWDRDLWG